MEMNVYWREMVDLHDDQKLQPDRMRVCVCVWLGVDRMIADRSSILLNSMNRNINSSIREPHYDELFSFALKWWNWICVAYAAQYAPSITATAEEEKKVPASRIKSVCLNKPCKQIRNEFRLICLDLIKPNNVGHYFMSLRVAFARSQPLNKSVQYL